MKTIQLEGNIRGEWKRLGFDIEPFSGRSTHGFTEKRFGNN